MEVESQGEELGFPLEGDSNEVGKTFLQKQSFLSARQEPRPERRRGPSEMCRLGMARGEASRPPEAGLKGPRRR